MTHVRRLLAACAFALVAAAWSGGSSASIGAATLSTFTGHWYGHTRGLTIDSKGRALESISDGCCDRIIGLQMTLSRPRGVATDASVTARVTWVRIYDTSVFGPEYPPPHPRETTTLHLNNGIITEPLTRTTYCDLAAEGKGICGA